MPHPYANHPHIGIANSFAELNRTEFKENVNALCWHRPLSGDFHEIVDKLTLHENITVVTPAELMALALSAAGQTAREIILQDIQALTDIGAAPVLNLLKSYERDEDFRFITTDVYSFHVDRSPVPTDTYLCTYYGAASELIANDQAIQKVLIPEVRTQLQALHDGPDHTFDHFLQEHYFDLHYQALPHATPINCGVGNLWRLAVDHPTQKVLPCIHRAPIENEGELRLLVIC
ncbi:MAG: DUF1826 domain-containing protein [Flavobacterium sp. BFFFF2]|nr:MAG: DUF1826 domain-containing protein [Flavobacterium sp. BFFFF2]